MHLIATALIGWLLLAIIGPRGMQLLMLLAFALMVMLFINGVAWEH